MRSDSFTFSVFITEELDKKITILCCLLVPHLKIAHMHTLNSLKTLISHRYVSKKAGAIEAIEASPFQNFLCDKNLSILKQRMK